MSIHAKTDTYFFLVVRRGIRSADRGLHRVEFDWRGWRHYAIGWYLVCSTFSLVGLVAGELLGALDSGSSRSICLHTLLLAPYSKYQDYMVMILWPNKTLEPTTDGAVSSAVAVHATRRRWLSFLSLGVIRVFDF